MGVPVGEMFLHRSLVSYFLGGGGMIVGTSLFGGDFCWRAKRETPVRVRPPAWGATGTTPQRCTLGGLSLVWVGDDVQVGNATEGNRFG